MADTPLLDLRTTIVERLLADAPLTALLGGPGRVAYRPSQAEFTDPFVTFFDFGTWDPVVPLTDRIVQVDVWDKDLDRAERIADRLWALLDFKQSAALGLAPLAVLGDGRARIAYCGLTSDRDDPAAEFGDGDMADKQLEFRLIAYAL